MTSTKSEFWTAVAIFAAKYGLEAEAIAAEKLLDAMEKGLLGEIMTWREVAMRLPTILASWPPPPA